MGARAVHWVLVLLSLVSGVGAARAGTAVEAPKADSAEPEAAPRRFVPPRLGSPENRVSGATRGSEPMQFAALAPSDVGLTAREQPRLYWYNSLPIQGSASITIVDDFSDRVVLRATIPGPFPAGINSFPLSGTQGRINSETTYKWSLTVVVSKQDPSRTLVAGGLIERVPQPAESLWYDEVDSISQSIRHAPGDRALRQTRSALLERAGLTDIAAYDRAAAR